MVSLSERVQQWFGYRLARAPGILIRRTTARNPIVLDGQRLEARTQNALAILARSGRPPLEERSVRSARCEYINFPLIFEDPPRALARVEDRTIPGPGGELPIRLYRPRLGGDPMPILVYFHGGGGVIGDIETHDGLCRILAHAGDSLVLSVEYRLGPEDPFPAAPDDALAAFLWTARHASELHCDPSRIAVGGDSMGGNLAAVVSQLARDAGHERPCAQLLLYPGTDRGEPTRSQRLFAEGFLLTDATLEWFLRLYLGGADHRDPRVSPLRHPNLGELPPTVLVTAGFDPLRDEGKAYADALAEAGVEVRYRCHEGLIHGFAQMTGAVGAAHRAVLDAVVELRAIFDATP